MDIDIKRSAVLAELLTLNEKQLHYVLENLDKVFN